MDTILLLNLVEIADGATNTNLKRTKSLVIAKGNK